MNPSKEWRNFPIIPDEKFADLTPREKKRRKPRVVNIHEDDDDDSERPERLSEPDFSDLD